jgi:hypothetical protein
MSSLEDKFTLLGKAISANAETLSDLVAQGGEELYFDKTSISFNTLTSLDIVLGNVSEGYSASSLLMQLSHSLSRSDVNKRLAPDVDEWLNRVELRISQYRSAILNDNEDSRVNRLHEIRELVSQMREGLTNEVRSMQIALNTKFGHVSNIQDKYIENKYLIDYLSRLTDKLAVLDLKKLNSIVGQNTDLRRLLSRRLHETIKECRDDIISAIPRLQHLMWQFEKKNKQANQMWALYNYFRTNTPIFSYEPSDEELIQLNIGCQTLEIQHTLFPDIYDQSNQDVLSDIVSKLKPKKEEDIEYKAVGEVAEFDGDSVTEEKIDVVDELSQHLVTMLEETADQTVSCLDFWQRKLSHQRHSSGFMMLAHINLKDKQGLNIQEEFEPTTDLDATLTMVDFTVARAS